MILTQNKISDFKGSPDTNITIQYIQKVSVKTKTETLRDTEVFTILVGFATVFKYIAIIKKHDVCIFKSSKFSLSITH